MTDQHPISPPPPGLVRQWLENSPKDDGFGVAGYIAIQAARWGADKELEACANWLTDPCAADMASLAKDLRYSRRPKPPSLKERALDGLQRIETNIPQSLKEFEASCDVIRRALEQLDD